MRRSWNQVLSFVEKKIGRRRVACRPWKIFIEAASSCNLRCITCQHAQSRFGGVMSDEVFDRVKPLLRYARVVNEVGYGEPLMDRGFLDKLAFAKQAGATVLIYSNGTLLGQRIAERMVELGLDQITFSIDGATAETFESIRVGARFEQVMANIGRLNDIKRQRGRRRPLLRANFVGMRRNISELPRAVEPLAAVGIEELVLSDFWPHQPAMRDECLGLMEDEARAIVAETAALARQRKMTFIAPPVFHHPPRIERSGALARGGNVVAAGATSSGATASSATAGERLRIDPPHDASTDEAQPAARAESAATAEETDYRQFPCYEPWQTVYITDDGNVRPCCAISQSMGNLLESNLEEIWNNAAYQRLRATVNSPRPAFADCRNCLLRRRVRLGMGQAVQLGLGSLRAHGIGGTVRRVKKYLTEYF